MFPRSRPDPPPPRRSTLTHRDPPPLPSFSQAHTSGRLRVASLFSGCGVLDYGLTQAGHEVILQTESEEHAREVLAARFQGIAQPRDPSQVEVLPADTDVLCASVMSAELEGSWRESWSKDSAASKLKQVLRLMKASQRRGSGVPWVLIEASTALLESDGEGVPIVCDLVSEFERLGYRWAHRTVAAAAFGVPDIRPRVLLVGSKHGDPRDVLLAEDAGANGAAFEPPGADQAQAFVFNKRPDGTVRVFSDFVEGFHPREGSCVLTPSGALAPLELHDAERLQGLPPGWTLTARPPAPGMPPADPAPRWAALAASLGCVPAAQWVGSRLANPYKLKHDPATRGDAPFDAPVTVPWPPAAYNVGAGRVSSLVSPFPRATGALPTLGGFVSPPPAEEKVGAAAAVPAPVALECARALRAAGWQPPPSLVAVEVAADAAASAAGVSLSLGHAAGTKRSLAETAAAMATDPAAAAAAAAQQAAALAALAPMMAAAAAAEREIAERAALGGGGEHQGAAGVGAALESAVACASAEGAAAHGEGAPRSKKNKTTHPGNGDAAVNAAAKASSGARRKGSPAAAEAMDVDEKSKANASDSESNPDVNDGSFTVAGITLRDRASAQVVWAKLPGHPFWPGLKVDLERDEVPRETLAMRKHDEALVIFFGENSFGWVREDQVLDFKEAYAEKAREPTRNKARFNSALQEALDDIEKRGVRFVPPAVHQRGKSGGAQHAHEKIEKNAANNKDASGANNANANANAASRETHSGGGAGERRAARSDGGGDKIAAAEANGGALGGTTPATATKREASAGAAPSSSPVTALKPAGSEIPAGANPSSPGAEAMMAAMAAAAEAAVASGATSTEGCVCRVCVGRAERKNGAGAQAVCLRIDAQRAASEHPIGAMLALQGHQSVGQNIEIYWPLDQVHYTAKITSYDPAELQHMVQYDADGVREFLCLWNEDIKAIGDVKESGRSAPSKAREGKAYEEKKEEEEEEEGGEGGEGAETAGAQAGAGDGGDAGAGVEGGEAKGADAEGEDAEAALLMGLQ